MKANYKGELDKLVQQKKKVIPTDFSEAGLQNIFEILESTPRKLCSFAEYFDENSSQEPIIKGKRSFRNTLVHFLNIEGLNYTTIYPALLLNKPRVCPLHAERDFNRLNLFIDFQLSELISAFVLERRKTVCFLKLLKTSDWQRQIIEEGKQRQETIYRLVRGVAVHDYSHIQTLEFQLRK